MRTFGCHRQPALRVEVDLAEALDDDVDGLQKLGVAALPRGEAGLAAGEERALGAAGEDVVVGAVLALLVDVPGDAAAGPDQLGDDEVGPRRRCSASTPAHSAGRRAGFCRAGGHGQVPGGSAAARCADAA